MEISILIGLLCVGIITLALKKIKSKNDQLTSLSSRIDELERRL